MQTGLVIEFEKSTSVSVNINGRWLMLTLLSAVCTELTVRLLQHFGQNMLITFSDLYVKLESCENNCCEILPFFHEIGWTLVLQKLLACKSLTADTRSWRLLWSTSHSCYWMMAVDDINTNRCNIHRYMTCVYSALFIILCGFAV